ncbi:MAG: class I SAM-dependent methyltransferase [Chitinophagales bacterium]|nr:class I SAM-dependent methyltransferase [Chitinophagales bacterium]
MYEFHRDKKKYFSYQYQNAIDYVIPFIEKILPLQKGMRVIEIGCAEGGVLKAFIEKGCNGVGVELSPTRAGLAQQFLRDEIEQDRAVIIIKNIYDPSFKKEFEGSFDLIILKDVIEHIFDQEKLIHQLKGYLKPGGKIFFGFPPWYMAFGGHQQLCKNKWLSKIPYMHLFPEALYKKVLRWGGESGPVINELMEIKQTGISIERFEKILSILKCRIDNRTFYLINPIYKYKFGWKVSKQNSVVASIPYLRDFFTTAMYYLVTPE